MFACSRVKLNRMGQAAQTAHTVREAGPAFLVLSLKCLELPWKVESGVTFFSFSFSLAPATC